VARLVTELQTVTETCALTCREALVRPVHLLVRPVELERMAALAERFRLFEIPISIVMALPAELLFCERRVANVRGNRRRNPILRMRHRHLVAREALFLFVVAAFVASEL